MNINEIFAVLNVFCHVECDEEKGITDLIIKNCDKNYLKFIVFNTYIFYITIKIPNVKFQVSLEGQCCCLNFIKKLDV